MFLVGRETGRTLKKPTHAWGKHANPTQKGPKLAFEPKTFLLRGDQAIRDMFYLHYQRFSPHQMDKIQLVLYSYLVMIIVRKNMSTADPRQHDDWK